MADLRESFPILEDDGTGAGEAPISRVEGEAAAAKEGLIGFSFKDSSGNVVLPQLDSQGRVVVTDLSAEEEGTCISGNGLLAGSTSEGTVVELSLTASKVYNRVDFIASCFRDTIWRVVYVDDPNGTPAETELSSFVTGPGQFSLAHKMDCLEFTAPSTDPVLRLVAKNLNSTSDMRGTLAVLENV